jgi:hypothetical protein
VLTAALKYSPGEVPLNARFVLFGREICLEVIRLTVAPSRPRFAAKDYDVDKIAPGNIRRGRFIAIHGKIETLGVHGNATNGERSVTSPPVCPT